MHNDIESASGDQGAPHALGAHGAARRRLARAGLGATGVVLTLGSKSALAEVCTSPSGFVSASPTNSQAPRYSCTMNGSHGYWKNKGVWSSAEVDPMESFGTYFETGVTYAHLKDLPMIAILDPNYELGEDEGKGKGKGGEDKPGKGGGGPVQDIDPNNVAMQTICAFLNARRARLTGQPGAVLTPEQVQAIWSDFVFDGSYLPREGAARWGGAEIAYYFETTFQHD